MKKEYNFHDTKIISTKKLEDDIFELKLQCSEGFMNEGVYSLISTGGKLVEIPDDFACGWWIYNEINLSDIGKFDLNVLFSSDNSSDVFYEIRIVADDVLIKME